MQHRLWLSPLWLLVFFISGGIASAADSPTPAWVTQVPAPQAGTFPMPAPRELHYTAGWSGMIAGQMNITFSNSAGQQTLHATGGTIGVARTLFSLDSDFLSQCDPVTLAPGSSTIVETYSDEKRLTKLRFDAEKITRQRTSQPAQKDDGKTKIIRLPHVLDLQSSLLFLRSQPLQVGDQITFLTYATSSPYLARVTVLPKEEITVPAGKYSAYKLHLELNGIDKKLRLKPYRKARNITAWLSDDADRLFLKFTADLFIGAVFVELEK